MTKRFRTRQNGRLESLERRDLLTVTPQLVGDFGLSPPSFDILGQENLESDNAWLEGEVFFAADDGTGDVELWKSDGTESGTVRVRDIRNGVKGSLPRDFAGANGRVLFTAYSDEFGRELWATDGTGQGTVLVKDLALGTTSRPIDSLTPVGDDLYFRFDGALWITNGTSSGTQALTSTQAHWLTPFDDKLFFNNAGELWVTDGTQDGTIALNATLAPQSIITVGDVAYISGYEGLWRSDGTSDGTMMLADQSGQAIAQFGNDIYFNRGNQLWKTDGTPEGTQSVKRLASDQNAYSWSITALEDELILGVGDRLRRSEGTSDGTQRLKSNLGRVDPISVVGDTFYFGTGDEIWASDGTKEGTRPVSGFDSCSKLQPRVLNGVIYFSGSRDDVGQELWRIDATNTEPKLLDISPGPADSSPWVMASNGEKTLFWTTDRESRGLWATTESFESATLLSNSILGPSGNNTDVTLVEVDGKVLIDGAGGSWITDGHSLTSVDAHGG